MNGIYGDTPYSYFPNNAHIQTTFTSPAYSAMNALCFRSGEIGKLQEIDKQIDDCRRRRKAAILRISRMYQD